VSQHKSRKNNSSSKEKYFELNGNKSRLGKHYQNTQQAFLVPENTFIGRPVQHRFNREKTMISIKARVGENWEF